MEYDYEPQPEEMAQQEGGEIQALGGGIYSVQKWPKPNNLANGHSIKSKGAQGKSTGKGKFRPKQAQIINTFLKPPLGINLDHGGWIPVERSYQPQGAHCFKPTGTEFYAGEEPIQYH